tara:strand:+ start:18232 stop:19074 length:843 start_codon:yes stop_codon:yes gene_type:complete
MAVFSAIAAGKARKAQKSAQQDLNRSIANRQEIINPYSNVTDLSNMISNPFANLQVATGAAEMQAEEADIALASTLDTLRATGAGSAGATALAQAALRSQQGIAATIEQQEAQNARLRAQGEQTAQQRRMAEAQRMQQADILGRTFQFQAQESRDIADISRQAGMVQQYGQQRMNALTQMGASTGAVLGGLASAVTFGGAGGGGGAGSDRRLKQNIKFLKLSPSGLKIYSFEYINKIFGKGVYQGVMSDEIPQYAVIKHVDGFDRVDYSKLDVEFKQIKL